jgi:hypothetical protein
MPSSEAASWRCDFDPISVRGVADVFGTHPDIGPELRQLAQAILDWIDPAVRSAAAMASGADARPGKCQQVWCPVCTLAALVTGEQHPLVAVIAEHSGALLAVIRAMVADIDSASQPPPGGGASADAARTPPGSGRYQHIEVTVEE